MKLKTVSLLCVGSVLLCGILACSNQAKQSTEENNDEQQLFIGDNIAVAQTQYGKVKGFILKGNYNFRGVPYGASTAGEPLHASSRTRTVGRHSTCCILG